MHGLHHTYIRKAALIFGTHRCLRRENSMYPTVFSVNSTASRANSQATGPSIAVDLPEMGFYSPYKLLIWLNGLWNS